MLNNTSVSAQVDSFIFSNTSVTSQAESFVFRKRSGDPRLLIFKKHKNKLFIAILESDYPIDSLISDIAAAVLNSIVGKYDDHKR
ncbi:MAG: hypothetical protein DRI61_04510 [Chloroflexi bacterium]|nr:MAG: hypothetical protein DRI61_04510 [Chloroflexota bacterium]